LSVMVSFRVSKELKKMDELRGLVNWSDEARGFIERRVKEYEQLRAVEELKELVKSIPVSPKGSVTEYVREDRDSG